MQAFIYRHDINAEDTAWLSNFYFLNEWVKLHCSQLNKDEKNEEYTITSTQFHILRNTVESLSNSVLRAFSKVFNTQYRDECEANDLRLFKEGRLNIEVGFDILDDIDMDFYLKLQYLLKSIDLLSKQNSNNINYTYYVSY
jgi:hypothetical protein